MKTFLALLLVSIFSISLTAQNNNCNCCTNKHAEFDFWVGKWDVTNPDGTAAGKNVVDKIQDNCILRENWTSSQGSFTGTSNNFYNLITKQWEQIWVDNRGASIHLKGNRIGNQMILQTDETNDPNGQPFYHRVTWTLNNDGSVRQFWETITNGTEIVVAFDGLYKKR